MKKHLFLVLIFIFLIVSPLFAPTEEKHKIDLMKLVLGKPFPANTEEQSKFELISKAAYLCIDQFGGYKLFYLDDLRQFGVKNLPNGGEINFPAGGHHERYTHRGWDWINYPTGSINNTEYNFQEIWKKRKMVLLLTLEKLFDFKKNEETKLDSLGALIYYTHLLGDHCGNQKGSYMDRMPITARPDYRFNRSGPNGNNPTIYTELLYHLPRLFRDQLDSGNYRILILFLQSRRTREFPTGTEITDEEYAQLQAFAQETLEKLLQNIPRLLQEESFFKRAFPQPNSGG